MQLDTVNTTLLATLGRSGESRDQFLNLRFVHADWYHAENWARQIARGPRRPTIQGEAIVPGMPQLLEDPHAMGPYCLHQPHITIDN